MGRKRSKKRQKRPNRSKRRQSKRNASERIANQQEELHAHHDKEKPVVIDFLGQGSPCQVHILKYRSTGVIIAGKTVRKEPDSDRMKKYLGQLRNEATIMRSLKHAHLPRFLRAIEEPESFTIHLTPVVRQNLDQYFRRNCSQWGSDYHWMFRKRLMPSFGCLAAAAAYLHSKGVRHNDLKPGNILVDDEGIWIIDFGSAIDTITTGEVVSEGRAEGHTELYAAPEMRNGVARSFPCDIFALGCIYLEELAVMCGRNLTDLQERRAIDGDRNYRDKIDWILRVYLPNLRIPTELQFHVGEWEFHAMKKQIAWMLQEDPSRRPTASQLTFGPSFQKECCPAPQPERRNMNVNPSIEVTDNAFNRSHNRPLFGEVSSGDRKLLPNLFGEPIRSTSAAPAYLLAPPLLTPGFALRGPPSVVSLSSAGMTMATAPIPTTPGGSQMERRPVTILAGDAVIDPLREALVTDAQIMLNKQATPPNGADREAILQSTGNESQEQFKNMQPYRRDQGSPMSTVASAEDLIPVAEDEALQRQFENPGLHSQDVETEARPHICARLDAIEQVLGPELALQRRRPSQVPEERHRLEYEDSLYAHHTII